MNRGAASLEDGNEFLQPTNLMILQVEVLNLLDKQASLDVARRHSKVTAANSFGDGQVAETLSDMALEEAADVVRKTAPLFPTPSFHSFVPGVSRQMFFHFIGGVRETPLLGRLCWSPTTPS
jgi:hypothetical protein